MAAYTVVFESNCWWVKEIKTGFLLADFNEKSKAKEFARKLNDRCGFQGETPEFFLDYVRI